MMAQIYRPLLTKEYSTALANEIRNYSDASCYLTIGKTDAWSGSETLAEFAPPLPIDDNNYKHQFWQDVIGYIRIAKENTRLVIDRVDWIVDSQYTKDDIVVVYNTVDELGNESYPDALDGFMMYRCLVSPTAGTNSTIIPTGFGASTGDLGDGYEWEYLYTIPPLEISSFCTPEYVVVPSEEELISDLAYWSREMVSSTVFDNGRMCYSIGAHKLMLRTVLADNYFRNYLEQETSYRQIGVVLKPYSFTIAAPCESEYPWFGTDGACSLFGWKIIANPGTAATYESYEILANTGELLYMENRAPIFRSFNETNDIRIILGF